MANRQWTVFAVYIHDQNEIEPYDKIVEAKTAEEAEAKIKAQAEYVTKVLWILPGKDQKYVVAGHSNVVPIRGKKHEINVTHVRIAKRAFFIPGRCPGCKKDLRLPHAMLEKYIEVRTWAGHLSHNNKDFVHERDFTRFHGHVHDVSQFDTVMLICHECKHIIWDGLHADE